MPNITLPGPRDDDKVKLSCKVSAFFLLSMFKLWAYLRR